MSLYLYSLFLSAAIRYSISVNLLIGLCSTESRLDMNAINYNDGQPGVHSYGLGQIQYPTARHMGYKRDRHCTGYHINKCGLLKPEINLDLSAKYLKYQLDRYKGNINKALSAYNAGTFTNKNFKYVKEVLKRADKDYVVDAN